MEKREKEREGKGRERNDEKIFVRRGNDEP